MRPIPVLVLLALLATASAEAKPARGAGPRSVAISSGIVYPAPLTALRENPSGLADHPGLSLMGSLESDDDFSPLSAGGQFLAGNGQIGGGVWARTDEVVSFGVGAEVESFGFGLAGSTRFGTGGFSLDVGLHYDGPSELNWGALIVDLADGVDALGFGVGFDVSPQLSVGVDGGVSLVNDKVSLVPGIGLRVEPLEVTLGYGLGDLGAPLARGVMLGLGFSVARSLELVGYYNHLSELFLGLGVRF
jgi:hypothetical protein